MRKLVKDSTAFKDPLNELGWKDSNFKDYEDQRDYLKKNKLKLKRRISMDVNNIKEEL